MVLQSNRVEGANNVKLLLNNTFTHFNPKNMTVVKKRRDLLGDLHNYLSANSKKWRNTLKTIRLLSAFANELFECV